MEKPLIQQFAWLHMNGQFLCFILKISESNGVESLLCYYQDTSPSEEHLLGNSFLYAVQF